MNKINVLIIEDDSNSAFRIQNSLELAGYDVIGIASDADSAIEFVNSYRVDVIISDIQIKGDFNGIQIVELIHKIKKIPTIFLTAHHDDATLQEVSKVNLAGYIVKPYLVEQLLREVKLLSLRYGLNRADSNIELENNYHFNSDEQKFYCNDKLIELTKQELALMQILIQNIGQIIRIETIELALWYDKAVNQNTRRQLLFRLKSKVHGLTIETINGVGYKLQK